jgi:hypothetical protein
VKFDSPLREELLRIIEAAVILSPSSFTFQGNKSSGIAMPVFGLQLNPKMPPLMSELTGQLYHNCYAHRFPGRGADAKMLASDQQWVETLSRANHSREGWQDAWLVEYQMPNGHLVATRGAITRTLAPGEFINLGGSGMTLAPGASVRVYVPRESRTMQPGYYFMFGETLCDSSDEFSMVRFYWNAPAEGIVDLLESISVEFNKWQVPFRFKTGMSSGMLTRADGSVLYTPRRYANFAFELAREISRRVPLRDEAPLFTLRLEPGLAFAEDPGTQESFGMSRCRMLAYGIWLAHEQGAREPDAKLNLVEQQFQSEGISLDRPWLNRGSANEFSFANPALEAA